MMRASRRGGAASAASAASVVALALLATGCRRETAEPPSGTSRPSILLVTLDTTRADHLGAYGSVTGATPNLDALAARGVVFERAYAVAPMTLPAHATMLTGRLPTLTGVRWNGEQRLADSPATLPTLAERLHAAGYATGAFVSAAVLDHAFGLDRGFERYDDAIGALEPVSAAGGPTGTGSVSGGISKAERPAQATIELARAWLEGQPRERPVFLWVHLFEPHDPYVPPAPIAARFPGDPYSGELAAADVALGTLLDDVRFRTGSGAIVSVIGDHGESLGEHGEATHGILLHEAVLHVPWIVAAPGLAPRRIAAPVSQADLAPTLLGLAATTPLADAQELDGEDLGAVLRGLSDGNRARTLYAESLYANALYGWSPLRSTRRGSYKWVAGVRGELYDFITDPGETRDLRATLPSEAGTLDRALGDVRDREAAPTAGSVAVDAALHANLQSLGYLAGGAGGAARGEQSGEATEDPRDRIALHERLRTVDAQWRHGDVAGAERALDELFAADPGNRLLRDVVERQLRGAIAQLAVSDAPAAAALRIRLAQLVALGGRGDEARSLLEASAVPPVEPATRAVANLSLATLALGERRFEEAELRARAATVLAPRSAAAQNTLALALDARGRTAEAESAYRAALALDPALFASELNLARLLAGSPARHAEAAEHLRRFLARAPAGDPRTAEASAALAHLSAEGRGGG